MAPKEKQKIEIEKTHGDPLLSFNQAVTADCSDFLGTALHVDDKSGAGGLLPGEIPGILNICVCDREPSPAVQSTLMPLPSRNTNVLKDRSSQTA